MRGLRRAGLSRSRDAGVTVDATLFEAEIQALKRAHEVIQANDLTTEHYRRALQDLAQHYQRLIRETHRLIRHGDRSEAELSIANSRLQQLSAELEYKARHDSLTGTLNRSAIFERARDHLRNGPLALLLLDIDFFKHINDRYGHPAGDAVLKEFVERLALSLAGLGDIGRVGGEEFMVLLPELTLQEAAMTAESLRLCIAKQAFSCLPKHPMSASFGVSWHARHADFAQAYACVDAALYRAKNQGRNQISM